jgi:PDZ domain-containing secreted protein
MKMELDQPPGTAWRLDGWLVIDGVTVDPPGSWYWLTAGRPPIVAEVVRSWFFDDDRAPASMRNGRRALRPAVAEPAAAAVGLRRAGRPVEMGVTVEVGLPRAAHLPDRAVVTMMNGRALTSRTVWESVVETLGDRNTITTANGARYEFAGAVLPFDRVDVIDITPRDLDVTVGGRLAQTVPGQWFRGLALGRSHGLMVALVSYVFASGDDLAAGRTIAGTGTIRADGAVGPVGGLRAKATAARHVGADVLLYPAAQRALLDGFRAGSMRVCAVTTLEEAIAALATSNDAVRSPARSARPPSSIRCS